MRPNTLAATIGRRQSGRSREAALAEFINAFDLPPTDVARYAILEEAPTVTDDRRLNALTGALAEYLAKQRTLGRVPPWTSNSARCLARPGHASSIAIDWRREYLTDGMREYLTSASPAEFSSHNIFIEETPLRWARRAPEPE